MKYENGCWFFAWRFMIFLGFSPQRRLEQCLFFGYQTVKKSVLGCPPPAAAFVNEM